MCPDFGTCPLLFVCRFFSEERESLEIFFVTISYIKTRSYNESEGIRNWSLSEVLKCEKTGYEAGIRMEEYIYKGNYEGYDVYIAYAEEGPTIEEAYALYREACRSARYHSLVEMAESEVEQE